jgi:glycosyltransferase involved in cell wall biosynthesis
MADNHASSTPTVKKSVRPVLLVDRDTLKDYATSLRHLFVGLAEQPCPAALICPPDARPDSVVCPPVKIIPHPMFKVPLFRLQNRKAVLAKLAKFKPTVLHSFGPGKARLTRHLSAQLDIPYVLTFNSLQTRRLLRFSVSPDHCAALIASSDAICENLRSACPRFTDRISRINIGVFVEETCACFTKPGRTTSMVATQHLDNPLDFEPLLCAVKHLAVDGYEFVIAIIGLGRAAKKLYEIIKALGLSQIVTIIGDIHPLRSVFAGSDIFILPQPSVDFNPHLVEAMSTGVAVAACHGGLDDLLVEDKTAVFFEPNDELSIYSCLQGLLDRREFARKIALAAQTYLKKHHSVAKMTSSLAKTYRSAQKWYKKIPNPARPERL